jgi:PAS domain S-box-containing protein
LRNFNASDNDPAERGASTAPGNVEPDIFPSTADIFHAVFENAYHANCIGNSHGRILEVNESVTKLFGYDPQEMIGLYTEDIFDTSTPAYAQCLMQRVTDEKIRGQLTAIRKNGERFLCEISSVVFTEDNGERRTINSIRELGKKADDLFS